MFSHDYMVSLTCTFICFKMKEDSRLMYPVARQSHGFLFCTLMLDVFYQWWHPCMVYFSNVHPQTAPEINDLWIFVFVSKSQKKSALVSGVFSDRNWSCPTGNLGDLRSLILGPTPKHRNGIIRDQGYRCVPSSGWPIEIHPARWACTTSAGWPKIWVVFW